MCWVYHPQCMSIDVTVLIAWTQIHGNKSMKSEAKHACDSYFATITKIVLCFLHSITASGLHFTVISLHTVVFCNNIARISNQ